MEIVQGDAFRVSYTSNEPRTAKKVTERLASLFIEENLRDREVLADGTNQFLDSQLEEARRRLLEKEKKLEDYRGRTEGSSRRRSRPTCRRSRARSCSCRRSTNRSIGIATAGSLSSGRSPTCRPAGRSPGRPISSAGTDRPAGGDDAQQLEVAQARLRGLELKLTPEHPDVEGDDEA